MRSLAGKKCFITGAASGIGRATALAAAAQGALLCLTDIQQAGLNDTVSTIEGQGGRVLAHQALDIADHAAVVQFAQAIHEAHGAMDVVMNIAGISIWGSVADLAHAQWRRSIEVNLMGPIHVIECFIPPMMAAQRGGHLVNVASAAGLFGLPFHAPYSASKFGLRGVSEVLRHDLRRHRITVSLVCPGAVDTGLVNTIQVAGVDMQHPQVQAFRQRFQRHAVTPDQAAQAILQGMQAKRWLIFTSADIRWGYWLYRKFAWPCDVAMRVLNNMVYKLRETAPLAAKADMPPQ